MIDEIPFGAVLPPKDATEHLNVLTRPEYMSPRTEYSGGRSIGVRGATSVGHVAVVANTGPNAGLE